MKCEVNSNSTHGILISKEISYKSFKEVCGMEKKKVNLGFNYDPSLLDIENNTMWHYPLQEYFHDKVKRISIEKI